MDFETLTSQLADLEAEATEIRFAIVDMLPGYLRQQRSRHGLTQAQLAGRLGVSWGYVGQMETGRLARCPRSELLRKMVEVFGEA